MSRQTDAGEPTVEQVCRVFGLSRSGYDAAQKPPRGRLRPAQEAEGTAVVPLRPRRYPAVSAEALQEAIRAVVDRHPAWGVRKVWATLRRAPYDLKVSRRRVWAFMKAMGLCLSPDRDRRAQARTFQVMVEAPNRRWATDLTPAWTEEDGLVGIAVVIDCGCRTVLAIEVTKSQESWAVLAPVRAALATQFGTPQEVPDGLELRTDHGPQYTGYDCEDLCDPWRLDHTLAAVGRPTGNAGAERVIRTLKEECIWLRDWKSRAELQAAVDVWRDDDNHDRPHQALAWQTPVERRAKRLGVSTHPVAQVLAA